MGVDLALLVVDGRFDRGGFSHSMFEFGRYYDLFELFKEKERTLPGFELSGFRAEIPNGKWKGENGYGTIKETPYGKPLTYLSAKEFKDRVKGYDFGKDWRAKAAVAYIRALPSDTLIGMYYH